MRHLLATVAAVAALSMPIGAVAGGSAAVTANVGVGMFRAVPPPDMLLVMVRSTLLAVGHGNLVDDYSVVWKLSAKSFQKKFDAATISKLLEPIRAAQLGHHALAVLAPQFREARVDDAGFLRLIGTVAIQPRPLEFRLLFEAEDDGWRLAGMGFSAMPPQVVAQAAPVQQVIVQQPHYVSVLPPTQPPKGPAAVLAPRSGQGIEGKPKRVTVNDRLEGLSKVADAARAASERRAVDQIAPSSIAELRARPLGTREVAVVSGK